VSDVRIDADEPCPPLGDIIGEVSEPRNLLVKHEAHHASSSCMPSLSPFCARAGRPAGQPRLCVRFSFAGDAGCASPASKSCLISLSRDVPPYPLLLVHLILVLSIALPHVLLRYNNLVRVETPPRRICLTPCQIAALFPQHATARHARLHARTHSGVQLAPQQRTKHGWVSRSGRGMGLLVRGKASTHGWMYRQGDGQPTWWRGRSSCWTLSMSLLSPPRR
jgi:hypothetical protein